jgi:hypothetical protein
MFTAYLRTATQFANNVTGVTMTLTGFNQNEYKRCQKVRAPRLAPAINYFKKSRMGNRKLVEEFARVGANVGAATAC